jgi:hypothetical protein
MSSALVMKFQEFSLLSLPPENIVAGQSVIREFC